MNNNQYNEIKLEKELTKEEKLNKKVASSDKKTGLTYLGGFFAALAFSGYMFFSSIRLPNEKDLYIPLAIFLLVVAICILVFAIKELYYASKKK